MTSLRQAALLKKEGLMMHTKMSELPMGSEPVPALVKASSSVDVRISCPFFAKAKRSLSVNSLSFVLCDMYMFDIF